MRKYELTNKSRLTTRINLEGGEHIMLDLNESRIVEQKPIHVPVGITMMVVEEKENKTNKKKQNEGAE